MFRVVILLVVLIGLWVLVPNRGRRHGAENSENASSDYEYRIVDEAQPQTVVR